MAYREKKRLDVDQALQLPLFREFTNPKGRVLGEVDQNRAKEQTRLSFKIKTQTKKRESSFIVRQSYVNKQSTVSSDQIVPENLSSLDRKEKKNNSLNNSIVMDHSVVDGSKDELRANERRKTDFTALKSHFALGKKRETKKSLFYIKSRLNI